MVFQSSEVRPKTIGLGIQARLGSHRFPKKIFREVEPGLSLIQSCINRAKEFKELVSNIGWNVHIGVLCPLAELEQISEHIKQQDLFVHGGDADDVFARYETFHTSLYPDMLMRITGDCPYWSPRLAYRLLQEMVLKDADFGWIRTPNDFPDGLDVEIIRRDLFDRMTAAPRHMGIAEHVTIGLKGSWEIQPKKVLILPKDDSYNLPYKLSIDTEFDLNLIKSKRGELWWIQPNTRPDFKKS